jgi:lysophospholipase L1-like esterase
MRVLIFGDSITQGFWDTEGGWAARLRKYYDERQIEDLRNNDEPMIFNLGISDDNSKTILDRFDPEVKARKNGEELAIVVSTGVNDSYIEGENGFNTSPEDYEKNLQGLATRAKNYSQKVIFVGLIAADESRTKPAFWRNISYLNERIKSYENTMQKVAEESEIQFVPIHNDFKAQLDRGKKLLADGLHPNNDGHELIFKSVLSELEKLLG